MAGLSMAAWNGIASAALAALFALSAMASPGARQARGQAVRGDRGVAAQDGPEFRRTG